MSDWLKRGAGMAMVVGPICIAMGVTNRPWWAPLAILAVAGAMVAYIACAVILLGGDDE